MTREEAIEKVREMKLSPGKDAELIIALHTLIPELAESDDEKIKKDIINLIYWLKGNPSLCSQYYNDRYDSMLAYLEKQKEQKPAEIAPNQFDGITYGMQGHSTDRPKERFEEAREKYQVEWSEKDKEIKKAISCAIAQSTHADNTIINGITKDEALAYLERQDSSKWSDEDEYALLQLMSIVQGYEKMQKNQGADCIMWSTDRQLPQKLFRFLKSIKPRPKQEWSEEEKDKLKSIERLIVNANAHGNYLIGDKEAIELQHFIRSIVKPTTNLAEWSEEDRLHYANVLEALEYVKGCKSDYDKIEAVISDIAWLKSLRPQPKAELSEDVKKTLDEVSHIFVGLNYKQIAKDYKRAVEKLLYSRPSWKPSEQEKGALRTAIHILTDERSFPKAAAQLQNILDAFEGKESRKDWKPSEEQMEALKCAVEDVAKFSKRGGRQVELENEPYYSALHSLYCNLEKLM